MNVLRAQLTYLRDRAEAISSGAQRLDGSLRQRAALYINAARSTFWGVRTTVHGTLGDDEEMRVLHALESCVDCIGYAAQGWQPLGSLPEPGESSRCGSNCRCSKSYRRSP